MLLKNKVAIITGAAGGIGRAVARFFADSGAQLVLIDLDEAALNQVIASLPEKSKNSLTIVADVADESDVKSAVASVLRQFDRIDILVNCAGICKMISILDIEVAEWDRIMAVNLRSVFLFSKEVFRHMRDRRYGKIINIASAAAKIGGLAAGAHYSASKAGVICFTKSLALQAAAYKINVNAVCPGPTKTEMTNAWGQQTNNDFADKIPFKQYAHPDDIAAAVLFLASDNARYITGEILDVNGGLVMD
ncbi:MAG: SDR family oxidoreductase [Sedimentisphaerales bacterium]|nr:SDR family oxidoreductase [Sedimentisphaerales bacterium]